MSSKASNEDERISILEKRLTALESFIDPTPFKQLLKIPIFPIHHKEMPEEVEIRILAYLSKRDYLTCKLVCKRWDSLRHRVAVMRNQIATPLKKYTINSKNYPSLYWTVHNRDYVRIDVEDKVTTFTIVPGIYRKGDERAAHSWNQSRFDTSKHTLVSFKSVSCNSYLTSV